MKLFDLIVIGAGPGGYVAAIRGAQSGLSVALIEKEDRLGGTCLHRGCIPSKAYLAAAEMLEMAKRAERVGITFGAPKIDFKKIVSSKDDKVGKLSRGISDLTKGNKIEVITGKGEATLEDAKHVKVGGEILEGRFLLLATGTEPVRPAAIPVNGKSFFPTDELFPTQELPKSLLVVGAGVSGCEMACAFNLFGTDVTLVELLPEILVSEERSAAKGLRTVLEKRGVKILTGISVTEMKEAGDQVKVRLSSDKELSVEKVLVAIGRRPKPDQLGLSRLRVAMEKGFVKVNGRMETSVEGVYAVGDLVGTTMLAHGAMEEGICAVENIAGTPATIDYSSIPRVVYAIPEIASVGSKENELKKNGTSYRVGRFSYLANGKALVHEEQEGFAQVYVGKEGENKEKVLGAVVFGAHAADLIQEVSLVMKNKLSVDALIDTVHAHPTLGEIIHEAAEDAQGMAIHKLGRRISP